jgi:transposase
MKPTQQRGLQIAARLNIFRKEDGTWSVPSQAGKGRYVVEPGEQPKCTCSFHETNGGRCKHIFAVEYFISRELHGDGSETVTETLTVTETVKRKTYPQNWPAYNAAQTNEKALFQQLLFDLCSGLTEQPQGNGRPRIPISDAIFSAAFKVYSTVSCRRFMCDLADAQAKGYIRKVSHFNTIYNYLEMPELTEILTDLITESSLPFASIETNFAVDSTGFGSTRFTTWYSTKYGDVRDQHDWVKTHICSGVKTNVVTAIAISERYAHDAPFFRELVQHTSENFHIEQVLADKGYSSKANLQIVEDLGAVPYIAFKKNAKPDRTRRLKNEKPNMWTRAYHFYSFHQEEFLEKYHQRSNVESTFMSMKAKFGHNILDAHGVEEVQYD